MRLCYQRRSFTFKYEHTYSPRTLFSLHFLWQRVWMGVLIPRSRFFFTTIPHPELLSLIRIHFCAEYRILRQDFSASRVAVKSVSHQEILLFPESRAIFLSNPMDLYIHILFKKWMCPDVSSKNLRQLDSRERPLTLLILCGRVGDVGLN